MNYQVLSKYRPELMGGAMLWVMLFHAFDLDVGPLEPFRAAGFGGVDIFILLSSVGLVLSLSRKEQDFSSFMARRAARVLPAYYVVMLPYTLFLILVEEARWSTLIWNSTLFYYWVSCKGAFNWYVAGSMLFYALTPFCFRRLERASRRELWVALGMAAGLLACQVLVREDSYRQVDVFYRVPVFLLGLLVGFYVREGRKLTGRDWGFWALWLGLGAGYLTAASTVSWDVFPLPLCHLFLFTTVPMCLVGCWCFDHLPLGWLRRFLRLLGEHSLEIYLLNVSVFSQTARLRELVCFGPTNRLYYLLIFTINIALGILLHKLVEVLRRARRKAWPPVPA